MKKCLLLQISKVAIVSYLILSACNSKPKHQEGVKVDTPAKEFDNPRITKEYDSAKVEKFYPFIIYKDQNHMIAAEIESEELYEKYGQVFEKYGYSGNGYSWEGHIRQILEKENPSLLQHIEFDPEAGGFYAFADSEKSQREFVETLSPIFSDLKKLANYLEKAERSRIDD